MTLTVKTQGIIQSLAVIVQVLNSLGDVVPKEWVPVLAALVGFLQVLLGTMGHYRNPDGTSAYMPYKPAPGPLNKEVG